MLPVWPADKKHNEEPEGSGVVVLDGRHIITALHVLGEATHVRIATHDGDVIDAQIVGRDEATDLALLKIERELKPLAFGGDPDIGDEACAIGNAFGLGLSLTCGTVSAVHRAGTGFNPIEDFVQTDAAVNPGASGGALVAADGTLIGVLSAIFTKQSDANIGVNFAVSAPLAARVAAALKAEGRVRHNAAGLRLVPALTGNDTGMQGAAVERVVQGGAGEKVGIAPGDVVLYAGSRRIRAPADFVSALDRLEPPASILLQIVRDGAEHEITLQITN